MDIKLFATELAALIGRPTELRPLVCSGSPLDCGVFIVGFNPATSMRADFWDFWRSDSGFDRHAWFESYKEDRRSRPLRPGKTRRNDISNSRRVIDWILEEATPIRCLETNIYSTPTEQVLDLADQRRITAPFDFLLQTIRPRILLVHGEEANKHLKKRVHTSRLIPVRHFSRGWSQAAARETGREVKRVYQEEGARSGL